MVVMSGYTCAEPALSESLSASTLPRVDYAAGLTIGGRAGPGPDSGAVSA